MASYRTQDLTAEEIKDLSCSSKYEELALIRWHLLMGCYYQEGPELSEAIRTCVQHYEYRTMVTLLKRTYKLTGIAMYWLLQELPEQARKEAKKHIQRGVANGVIDLLLSNE
uniref:Transcriptional regulator n=1 Tax=Steinernema glaseri TaxID=37863 RepID=A0A1I7ZMQ7_9BILA